jgi:uncharacterized protein YbjT (DUF2867 family)
MILVTTVGKVGAHAAHLLAAAGEPVRIVVRHRQAHPDLARAGVELLQGDLSEPGSLVRAVQGISSIVLVTPAVPALEIAVIDAARRAGVGHVTKITSDASPDSPVARRRDHHRIEQALAASGLPHTLVRGNAYMQNVLALAPAIAATGSFASSAGDGRIGMVDSRDVAAVAATIAASPERHAGATYRLSGPGTLSYDDVAAQLSQVLGRTITHRRISRTEQVAAMVGMGLPEDVARANAQALGLFAVGDADWVTEDVVHVTGRPARSFEQFAADHAARFTTAPS